ncbi:hypothetical protein SO3561_09520 [Streptomyces olivochromogenes]|uniref:Uncharacterized protein n=1 Tax=Streptomyces olivochromogenes TaxID=1963 RepID=A0A250VV44_STROL|nr:hypothetical protein SO3561_09520 [Streptomyces olivochromogenes]
MARERRVLLGAQEPPPVLCLCSGPSASHLLEPHQNRHNAFHSRLKELGAQARQ